eukprot:3929135-Prymnesium_polylepis.1
MLIRLPPAAPVRADRPLTGRPRGRLLLGLLHRAPCGRVRAVRLHVGGRRRARFSLPAPRRARRAVRVALRAAAAARAARRRRMGSRGRRGGDGARFSARRRLR